VRSCCRHGPHQHAHTHACAAARPTSRHAPDLQGARAQQPRALVLGQVPRGRPLLGRHRRCGPGPRLPHRHHVRRVNVPVTLAVAVLGLAVALAVVLKLQILCAPTVSAPWHPPDKHNRTHWLVELVRLFNAFSVGTGAPHVSQGSPSRARPCGCGCARTVRAQRPRPYWSSSSSDMMATWFCMCTTECSTNRVISSRTRQQHCPAKRHRRESRLYLAAPHYHG
jgi:hypothetical protein